MAVPPREVIGGFGSLRARCSECKKTFRPHVRLKDRQKTCAAAECRRRLRARYQQSYREKNPQLEFEYCEKRKQNLPPDFWRCYRRDHPISTKRNRDASRLRARLKREGLQRKLDIVQVIDSKGTFDRYREFAMRHRSLIEVVAGMSAA